jgi:Ca2+/Na+ antiporter
MSEPTPAHNLKDPRFLSVLNDLLKHFITLATGSIVLLVGFVERLAKHARWRLLIAVALLSFTLTVITSILQYSGLARQLFKERSDEETKEDVRVMGVLIQITWLSFISGLVSLVVLALRNLF